MRTSSRSSVLLCFLLSCLLAGCGAVERPAGQQILSQCTPAGVTVEPTRVAPGAPIKVNGLFFTSQCDDMGEGKRSKPDQNVRVWFQQGERTWLMATVDAAPVTLDFKIEATVPPDAAPGPATITADSVNKWNTARFEVISLPDTGGRASSIHADKLTR